VSFLTKRSGVMPEADAPFGAFRNLCSLPEEIPVRRLADRNDSRGG